MTPRSAPPPATPDPAVPLRLLFIDVEGRDGHWVLHLTFAPLSPDGKPEEPAFGVRNITFTDLANSRPAPLTAVAVRDAERASPLRRDVIVTRQDELDATESADPSGATPLPPIYRLTIRGAPEVPAPGNVAVFRLLDDQPSPVPSAQAAAQAARPLQIDYLAKDFEAFRQVMLSHMAVLCPAWQGRSVADMGIMLVEVLAYAADYLSYYQDAAATEAHLGTARLRTSVRRLARLLDYRLCDGVAARVWVQFEVARTILLPRGTAVLTTPRGARVGTVAQAGGMPWRRARDGGAEIFESVEDAVLEPALNRLSIHRWGQADFALHAGATGATLAVAEPDALRPGTVLIFEQIKNPQSGETAGVDPTRRWAVRVTAVDPADGTTAAGAGKRLVDVAWEPEDALPFDLVVASSRTGRAVTDAAVAWGNVVLFEHGRSEHRTLGAPEPGVPFRPGLPDGPLLGIVPFDPERSRHQPATAAVPGAAPLTPSPSASVAAVALSSWMAPWVPRDAVPEHGPAAAPDRRAGAPPVAWTARPDLLEGGPTARTFVAETEDDGSTTLRFGDGVFGFPPSPAQRFAAHYRVGDPLAGNIGAEAITTLVAPDTHLNRLYERAVRTVRNPMPATGGQAPETLAHARQNAPHAYRQPKALVTLADYEAAAASIPDVLEAKARLLSTGSWPTIAVAVRRRSGGVVDGGFCAHVERQLAGRRIAGRRILVTPPSRVPVGIRVRITPAPGADPADVTAALKRTFGTGPYGDATPDGGTAGDNDAAFFNPANWSFGQTLYASQVVDQAMRVAGVSTARVTELRRLATPRPAEGQAPPALLRMDTVEVVSASSTPAAWVEGWIVFDVKGLDP